MEETGVLEKVNLSGFCYLALNQVQLRMVSPELPKETKRGEMGGRESQHLIVPLQRGTNPRDPVKGRGCRLMSR